MGSTQTFWVKRVRGAMSDCLRDADHLSKDARQRVKAGEAVDVEHLPIQPAGYVVEHGEIVRLYAPSQRLRLDDRDQVERLLASFNERERTILLLRFFGNKTQTQIAEQIGLSQMHVSRLLRATLDKLRAGLLA